MKSGRLKYPRKNRVRKRKEFIACYEHGKRFYGARFLLYCQPAQTWQFGVAVSRKVGNAVQRNRVKRLLREFFRLQPRPLPMRKFVVVAKKGIGTQKLDLAAVESELGSLLARAAESGS